MSLADFAGSSPHAQYAEARPNRYRRRLQPRTAAPVEMDLAKRRAIMRYAKRFDDDTREQARRQARAEADAKGLPRARPVYRGKLGPTALAILDGLLFQFPTTNGLYPSLLSIARAGRRRSKTTALEALRRLEKHGFLTITSHHDERGQQITNSYVFHMPTESRVWPRDLNNASYEDAPAPAAQPQQFDNHTAALEQRRRILEARRREGAAPCAAKKSFDEEVCKFGATIAQQTRSKLSVLMWITTQMEARKMVIMRDGEPWWVLADVCAALELTEDETELRKCFDDDEISQFELTTIISEAGLYTLLFRVPGFSRLVWREIVPSIRKYGCYPPPGTQLASSHDPRQADIFRKLFAPLSRS